MAIGAQAEGVRGGIKGKSISQGDVVHTHDLVPPPPAAATSNAARKRRLQCTESYLESLSNTRNSGSAVPRRGDKFLRRSHKIDPATGRNPKRRTGAAIRARGFFRAARQTPNRKGEDGRDGNANRCFGLA
ncbi:hypothetical protein KM043_010253 [Ampulex compressa]|nr:hypothetical protein KM043_010253 [Ampulex compressa]